MDRLLIYQLVSSFIYLCVELLIPLVAYHQSSIKPFPKIVFHHSVTQAQKQVLASGHERDHLAGHLLRQARDAGIPGNPLAQKGVRAGSARTGSALLLFLKGPI